MAKLEGKVAIVTGAGQGIGKGIALAFAKEGAKVVVCARTAETINAVANEIRHLGGEALAVVCNVGNEEQVKSMVDQTVKKFGAIDILVNNAQSISRRVPLELKEERYWDRTFQTGVKATYYCCKAVFPYMKDRGGKIINFGSSAALRGDEGLADYSANKAAIQSLTRTIARE